MRKSILGGFFGALLAITFLAACGAGGGGGGVVATVVNALEIFFDNGNSGMAAENVQDALDEITGDVDDVEGDVATLDGRVDTLEADAVAVNGDIGGLEAVTTDHGNRITSLETRASNLESDTGDLDSRVNTLEGAQTAGDISYDNSSSGLTASTTQAAIDELAGITNGGSVFTRWGSTSAPTGTTKLYDGIAMGFADGGAVWVMKGGDPGATTTEGGFPQFLGTDTTSSRMPPGVTANRRIVACVCYSAKPTAVIYGTHTAPSGWSVLYKGYVMSNGHNAIVVDTDSFDASNTAGTESTRSMVTVRISGTHDSTNFPNNKHVKAAVIAKN